MARRIEVEIVGDATSLERAFKKSERAAKGFNQDVKRASGRGGGFLSGLTRAAGLATGALGVAGLSGAVSAAFGEMADAQKVSAQTRAVLKSTGGVANVSADQIDAYADSLMKKSGVDDEAIKSGENLLATFKNIRNESGKGNDIFKQATDTMLDMSTALGQDTKTSAIQLGKALNDPIKGVGALRRVGVTFTDQQKKMIKTLATSGDTLGAQKIILQELQDEFGGSAEAAGKTLPGQLNILKETAKNLGGSIAQILTPAIQDQVTKLVNWLNKSENQKKIIDTVKDAFDTLAGVVKTISGLFKTLSDIVGGNKNAFKLLLGVLVLYKGLKLAKTIGGIADSLLTLTGRTKRATGALGKMRGALVGRAGLYGAALGGGLAIGSVIAKKTGVDEWIAGKAANLFGPGKGREGLAYNDPRAFIYLRRQARRMVGGGGMTPERAAAWIARTHPRLAAADVGEVMRGININTVNMYGVQDMRGLENEVAKRTRSRPDSRRGAR